MKVVAIVQARMTSTRFPGKIKADLGGMTVLDRVVDLARAIDKVDEVVVAMPDGILDENDVLGRVARMARKVGADVIVRLTADCPFLDPQASSLVVKRYLNGDLDYASNVWPKRTWPDGLDTEVFSRYWLDRADEEAVSAEDREHVTPWIRRHATRVANIELPVDWSWVRLTLDTREDLRWLRECLKAPRS
jgi:spore coat polysaccharide biosynthesis protein SpsF